MLYVLAVGTGLLVFLPIITGAAVDPFAFEVPLDPDGIQRAVVEADSYEFSPRHLVVRAGKPVELTVRSVTVLVPHNVVIDDPQSGLAIKEEIPAGQTLKVTFTPSVKAWSCPSCSDSWSFRGSSRSCVPPPVRSTIARSFLPSCRSRICRVGLCTTNRSGDTRPATTVSPSPQLDSNMAWSGSPETGWTEKPTPAASLAICSCTTTAMRGSAAARPRSRL